MNRLSKIQAALLLAVALWPDEVKSGHFINEERVNGVAKDLDRVLNLNDESQWGRITREYVTQAMNVAYSESAKHEHSYPEIEVETIANGLTEDLISLSGQESAPQVANETSTENIASSGPDNELNAELPAEETAQVPGPLVDQVEEPSQDQGESNQETTIPDQSGNQEATTPE